jgi:hypothetical protein
MWSLTPTCGSTDFSLLLVSLLYSSLKIYDFSWSSNFRRLPSVCRLRPESVPPAIVSPTDTPLKNPFMTIPFTQTHTTLCPFYNVLAICHVLLLDIRLTSQPRLCVDI